MMDGAVIMIQKRIAAGYGGSILFIVPVDVIIMAADQMDNKKLFLICFMFFF